MTNMFIILFLSIFAITVNAMGQENNRYDRIQEVAQKLFYLDKNYNKAMNILEKANHKLKKDKSKSLSNIIEIGFLQVEFSLYEKGVNSSLSHIRKLCKDIQQYHNHLPVGFSYDNNAQILLLSEKITKNFICFPRGTKALKVFNDCFIDLYKKEKNTEYVDLFMINKADNYIYAGNLKKAYDIIVKLINNASQDSRFMYSITYGSCLLLYKKDIRKALKEFKYVIDFEENMIKNNFIDVNKIGFERSLLSRGLLMTLKSYREKGYDLSAIASFENKLKNKFVKKYYTKPKIISFNSSSQSKEIGLKISDVIESYDNELIYDQRIFLAKRMADKFVQNKSMREIVVNRKGRLLKYKVNPGMLGVVLQF